MGLRGGGPILSEWGNPMSAMGIAAIIISLLSIIISMAS